MSIIASYKGTLNPVEKDVIGILTSGGDNRTILITVAGKLRDGVTDTIKTALLQFSSNCATGGDETVAGQAHMLATGKPIPKVKLQQGREERARWSRNLEAQSLHI